jgi:uncharacterized protein YkwD
MYVNEMFNQSPAGYHNEKDDNTSLKLDDSRKTRITLAHLNQLRQSHDVRKLEHEKKLTKISKQYQVAPEAGAAGSLI